MIETLAGPVLAVAPHPDDESLGCGGLLALLVDAGLTVDVVLVSDGAASHPGSRRWPPERLGALRFAEMRDALGCLGVDAERLIALGLPDGAVPADDDPGFAAAAAALARVLARSAPRTLVVPWRRDAHADHRASHALVREAMRRSPPPEPARLLEYAVWDERASPDERPRPGEAVEWRVDIGPVRARKAAAIAAHRSQRGLVVDDDPSGFVLPEAMCERAAGPAERYWEVREEATP